MSSIKYRCCRPWRCVSFSLVLPANAATNITIFVFLASSLGVPGPQAVRCARERRTYSSIITTGTIERPEGKPSVHVHKIMSHSVARPSLLPPPATSTSAWNMSRHALRGQPSVLEPPMITCDDKWSFTYGSPGVTRGYGDILAKKAHGISISRGHECAHPSRRNGSRKPWSVRGGCTAGGDRRRGDRRARRPPTSFIVPALVW